MARHPDPYASMRLSYRLDGDDEFEAFRDSWRQGTPLDELYDDGPFALHGSVGSHKENRRGDVAKVQSLLHDAGYFDANDTDGPTGIYAPSLMDAPIRKFQQDHGLAVDGYLDPDGETIGRMRTLLGEHSWRNPFLDPVRPESALTDPDLDRTSALPQGGAQIANKAKPIEELFRIAPLVIDKIQRNLNPRRPLPDAGDTNTIPPSPAQPPFPPGGIQTPGFPSEPPFEPEEFNKESFPANPPKIVHGTAFPITADSKPEIYIFPDLSDELEQISIVENRKGNALTKAQLDRIRDVFLASNPGWEHIRGGRDRFTGKEIKEFRIPGHGDAWEMDSRPGSHYMDLTFKGPNDELVHIQTVDVDRNGLPTEQEVRVARRVGRATGSTVILIPKTWQLDRLKWKN